MCGINQSGRLLLAFAISLVAALPGHVAEVPPTLPPAASPDGSPARDDLPAAPGELPPAPDELPPARDDLPAAPGDLPPAPDELPPARDDLPAAPGDLPPTPDELPPATPGDVPSVVAPDDRETVTPEATARTWPAPKGSQLPLEKNMCATCHGESDIWAGENRRLYVAFETMAEDVHWSRGVNCHDCHGGDPTVLDQRAAHAKGADFRAQPEVPAPGQVRNVCGQCHGEAWVELRKGMHAKAGPRDEHDRGSVMHCSTCHGDVAHQLLPTRDHRSPMFAEHQVQRCGECHERSTETYSRSVHGHGLLKSGLATTAVCADCHGAHGVYLPADQRSTLHPTNVSETCGSCHRFTAERLERSVHGAYGAEYLAKRDGPEGTTWQMPSCTHCHEGHEIVHPESARFRQELPHRCGNCHGELSSHHYHDSMRIHGELTELGYVPAAKCSDCHGAHDIHPLSHAQSLLSAENRAATCAKCHPYATANFLQFRPHADHTNPNREPVLHAIYKTLQVLILSVFGFFGIHSVLWFVRSLIHVFQYGRPKTVKGTSAYRRFDSFDRACHTLLMVSFLGIMLTGLPLRYSHHDWSKSLVFVMGGFVSTSVWHRIFGVVALGVILAYMSRLGRRYVAARRQRLPRNRVLFGPDSPVPNFRDLKDLMGMFRWFLGLGPKPTFERWTYWEKFDFWAACAGIVLIGTTGLILWLPNLFSIFLPGIALNIAKVVHSTPALLVAGFVFSIHFFNTAFRPEKFPAGLSMPTGLMTHEDMARERPEFLRRLVEEGRLAELEETIPSRGELCLKFFGGGMALAVGVVLLAAMVLAGLGG